MNTKTLPPPPKAVRLTISVSPKVHQTFKRISEAGGGSTGRAMGDWLADTLDGAAFMAEKMEQARSAPAMVVRELHSYALGLSDQTTALMEAIRQGKSTAVGGDALAPRQTPGFGLEPRPPSCNTGGKVPPKGAKGQRGKPA